MALEANDIEKINEGLFQDAWEAIIYSVILEYFEVMKQLKYNPIKIKSFLEDNLAKMKKEEELLGLWKNQNTENAIEVTEAMFKVLFCDLIEVPLLINEKFSYIAKWRLEHNK